MPTTSVYWHNQFTAPRCLYKGKSVGRPRVSEENVQREKIFEINTDELSLTAGLVAMVQMTGLIASGLLDHRILFHATFFLWGFVKDKVYVPQLPANLPELRDRIREVVAAVTPDMLINVWEELAYRLDVCRVTNGAHIEHL